MKEAISRELKDPELLPHLQRLVGPERFVIIIM